jgi:aminopeptidase N
LNTLRQILNDDERWRQTLRGIGAAFYHQTVTTDQIETFMAEETGLELQSFFDQYLRTSQIPIFEYHTEEDNLIYRWGETLEGFNMPIDLKIDDESVRLTPTTSWQSYPLAHRMAPALEIDPNYYIEVKPFR